MAQTQLDVVAAALALIHEQNERIRLLEDRLRVLQLDEQRTMIRIGKMQRDIDQLAVRRRPLKSVS